MIAIIRKVRNKYMLLTFKDTKFNFGEAELVDRKFLSIKSAKEYAKKHNIRIYEE